MEIKVSESTYTLTLTEEEMTKLKKLIYDADYNLLQFAGYFQKRLEKITH